MDIELPKLRRPAPDTAAPGTPPGRAQPALPDSDKRRRNPVASALRVSASCLCRRSGDLFGVGALLITSALVYVHVRTEVLAEDEILALVFYHVLFVLTFSSWFGVIVHGPGRVPLTEKKSELPEELKAALSVGRYCDNKPFGWRDGWCGACECWKPSLAHHCSVCNRCCLWMDHHCMFTGQCVGFRNHRCFWLFLLYGTLLTALLLPLMVWRLIACRWIPHTKWSVARRVASMMAVAQLLWLLQRNARMSLQQARQGWHSHVMLTKFDVVMQHALDVQDALPQGVDLRQELVQARGAAIDRDSGMLRGFGSTSLWEQAELVFGEPFSWRWLLPLCPGGKGDPLRPTSIDETACVAWARIAVILAHCDKFAARAEQALLEQKRREEAQTQAWLEAAGGSRV